MTGAIRTMTNGVGDVDVLLRSFIAVVHRRLLYWRVCWIRMESSMRKIKLPAHLGWKFGIFIIVLSILSLGVGTKAFTDVNDLTTCQANYSAENSRVQAVRAAASVEKDAVTAKKDDAVSDLMDGIANEVLNPTAKQSRADNLEFRELLAKYQVAARANKIAIDKLAAERLANPLPPFPQDCRPLDERKSPVQQLLDYSTELVP